MDVQTVKRRNVVPSQPLLGAPARFTPIRATPVRIAPVPAAPVRRTPEPTNNNNTLVLLSPPRVTNPPIIAPIDYYMDLDDPSDDNNTLEPRSSGAGEAANRSPRGALQTFDQRQESPPSPLIGYTDLTTDQQRNDIQVVTTNRPLNSLNNNVVALKDKLGLATVDESFVRHVITAAETVYGAENAVTVGRQVFEMPVEFGEMKASARYNYLSKSLKADKNKWTAFLDDLVRRRCIEINANQSIWRLA